MLYFFLVCFLRVSVYAGYILAYTYGWHKKKIPTAAHKTVSTPLVTVVIALRNESAHLPALMQSLQQQTYPNFEVLLVNDHSDDDSEAVFTLFSDNRFTWINSDGMGKKAALRQGINQAKSDLILTTDADVVLPSTWLASMVNAYGQTAAQLLIGPVAMRTGTIFQRIDYFSLEGTTHGSAQVGAPILCSGANLAFSKTWYIQCLPYLHPNVPSGDDMFLLEATKRLKGKIVSLKTADATVQIIGCETFGQFLSQRARWASKAPRYTDAGICFVAGMVAFTQVACLVSLLVGAWYPLFFLVFLLKFVVDAGLIGSVAGYHKSVASMLYYPLVAVVYPFYVILVLLLTFFPNQWKERTL